MPFGVIIDLSNETKNRSRKGFKMTKKAMVEELINLGCIAEKDRQYLMRQTKDYVENRIYKVAIPLRMEYLKNQNNQ